MMQLLQLVQPFSRALPQIEAPQHPRPFKEKLLWTVLGLLVFLACCQIPLYGAKLQTNDPLQRMRIILASSHGSLMEFGTSPLINSGLIMQILSGTNLIRLDKTIPSQKRLFQDVQRVLAMGIVLSESFSYVFSGMYGTLEELGTVTSVLIILQLMFAGALIIVLDDAFEKGYGLGSAVSLFIAANTCGGILWNLLSPISMTYEGMVEYEGAVINFVYTMITRGDKFTALGECFYRSHLPNLTSFMATVLVFLLVIYLEAFRINIPIKSERTRGQHGTYPIKLFYTASMPIVLHTTIVSNIDFLSRIAHRHESSIAFVMGTWEDLPNRSSRPISGISYYLSPPSNVSDIVSDPVHALLYTTVLLFSCAIISHSWIKYSESSAKHVHDQLNSQNMLIVGYRKTTSKQVLNRYIPIAASFGGMCIGILTLLGDVIGVIGSGTGILVTVSTLCEYSRIMRKGMKTL